MPNYIPMTTAFLFGAAFLFMLPQSESLVWTVAKWSIVAVFGGLIVFFDRAEGVPK